MCMSKYNKDPLSKVTYYKWNTSLLNSKHVAGREYIKLLGFMRYGWRKDKDLSVQWSVRGLFIFLCRVGFASAPFSL